MDSNNLTVEIRPEEPKDFPAVYEVNTRAFKRKEEACLVDRLRSGASFIPGLSLVAIAQNKVVGHILLSKIFIEGANGTHTALALAPLAVVPERQRQGIGKSLMATALDTARSLGYKAVVVLGHTTYYSKFGFIPTARWNIKPPFNVPENAFMALELTENSLSGVEGIVQYSKEFEEL